MNLQELTERLHRIRDNNDWRGFHSPKNLAMAASVEMAELVEIFQWLSEDHSPTPARRWAMWSSTCCCCAASWAWTWTRWYGPNWPTARGASRDERPSLR